MMGRQDFTRMVKHTVMHWAQVDTSIVMSQSSPFVELTYFPCLPQINVWRLLKKKKKKEERKKKILHRH